MPERVVCRECGASLYEGKELKPPYEVVEDYNGRCPTCGRKLSFLPLSVEIEPIDEA